MQEENEKNKKGDKKEAVKSVFSVILSAVEGSKTVFKDASASLSMTEGVNI